jgi:uncharacterized integral membrane protein
MSKMPLPSRDTRLEVLNDHYKDSFSHLQEDKRLRDQLFILVIVFLMLMLFQIYAPKESGEAISEFISRKLELKNPIDISFLGSLIWFGLLGLLIRYFQIGVLLERQYKYIHALEDQLSKIYSGKAFTREGKSYLILLCQFSIGQN